MSHYKEFINDNITWLRENNAYDFIINKYYTPQVTETPPFRFFDGKYRFKFSSSSFTTFELCDQDKKQERHPSHFKLHYAVDHKDYEKAIEVVGHVCAKYNIPIFKFVNYPFGQSTINDYKIMGFKNIPTKIPHHDQDGKDFTIFLGEKQLTPEFMNAFAKDMEEALISNKINPPTHLGSAILEGDKQINGSVYGSYRYEKDENNRETSRHTFTPPKTGDFMDQVSLSNLKDKKSTINCFSEETLESTKEILSTYKIPFVEQKYDYSNIQKDSPTPIGRIIHSAPKSVQQLFDLMQQNSFENIMINHIDSSYQASNIQKVLNKMNIKSCRTYDPKDPTDTNRIILAYHKKLLTNLMKQLQISDLTQIDAALVSSKAEANRLIILLNKANIKAIKIAYQTADGPLQYGLVYQKNAKTDDFLKASNADFTDEKKGYNTQLLLQKRLHQNAN